MSISQSFIDILPKIAAISKGLTAITSATAMNADGLSTLEQEMQIHFAGIAACIPAVREIIAVLTQKSIYSFQQRSDFNVAILTAAYMIVSILQTLSELGTTNGIDINFIATTVGHFIVYVTNNVILPDYYEYIHSQPQDPMPPGETSSGSNVSPPDIQSSNNPVVTPVVTLSHELTQHQLGVLAGGTLADFGSDAYYIGRIFQVSGLSQSISSSSASVSLPVKLRDLSHLL